MTTDDTLGALQRAIRTQIARVESTAAAGDNELLRMYRRGRISGFTTALQLIEMARAELPAIADKKAQP